MCTPVGDLLVRRTRTIPMNHAVLQSLDRVSGMTCHRPCVHHPAQSDSSKAHWRQDNTVLFSLWYMALSWLFIRPLVSSWCENISVSFCLQAPRYGLTLWCALGLLVGGAVQVPQLQLQLQIGKRDINLLTYLLTCLHTVGELWSNDLIKSNLIY